MLNVVIDRAKWRRGGRPSTSSYDPGRVSDKYGDTKLLNDMEMMCCLGFCALALGIAKNRLKAFPNPVNLGEVIEPITQISPENGLVEDSRFSVDAMAVNDSRGISEEERESRLIELGKDNGVNFEFEGETPDDYWMED